MICHIHGCWQQVFDRFYVILQGGGTSCTDVESVNFNTEGSNTTSVVNSVGKLLL